MASLQIDLFDKIHKRRIWVMLRDNLPVKDLIHKLIQDLELPHEKYVLVNEENNLILPDESTLSDENIKDQHPLRIEPKSKIIPIPIPIPIKKGQTSQPSDPTAIESGSGKKTELHKKMPEQKVAHKVNQTAGKKPPANRPIKPWLRRAFRRPPFLRGIPNNFWNLVTPLNLVVILILLCIICLVSRCVINNQGPLAAMGDNGDMPPKSNEPMPELEDEEAEPEEKMVEEEVEIVLPDLDEVYASLPKIESDFPGVCYAVFNTEKEPFDDIRLREAFARSIDREYITQNWTCDECNFREQQPNYWLNPEEFYTTKIGGADLYDEWFKHDLPEGYDANEISIVLYASEDDSGLADLVAANWREYLGVDVELAIQEYETFLDNITGTNPPAVYVCCNYLDLNSPADFLLLAVADYYGDYFRWEPPAKYYQAVLEGYENDNEEAYLRAEKMLVEEYVVVAPIFSYNVD